MFVVVKIGEDGRRCRNSTIVEERRSSTAVCDEKTRKAPQCNEKQTMMANKKCDRNFRSVALFSFSDDAVHDSAQSISDKPNDIKANVPHLDKNSVLQFMLPT